MAMSVVKIAIEEDNEAQELSESHRDYALNLDKTFRKKLQAAKRQQVEYMVKDGGIVANMDAMSFEIFRFSCQKYYSSPVGQIQNIKKDSAKDTKGNIVQITYTVSLKEATRYTLNIYLTKCSLLINGKATQHFINEDLSAIHQIMSQVTVQGMKVDIKKLNELLATQLRKLIGSGNLAAVNSSSKPCKQKQSADDLTLSSNIECQKCKRNCKKRAVQCDSCDRWSHYNCEKLTESEIKLIEGKKDYIYRCMMCKKSSPVKHVLMLPAL
ncbi:MAG: PHD finger domain-containing protein [Candidatus Thiodiazotropha sp.]